MPDLRKTRAENIRLLAFWLTLAGISLTLAPASAYLYLLTRSPVSFEQMDFDGSGFVTFSELVYAGSYGTRKLTKNGQTCTEYFSRKDGRQFKLECNGTLH